MPAKPGSKNSDDLKMVMAALAVATTLGLWNLFATNDKKILTETTVNQQTPPPIETTSPTQPAFRGKILLGGQAPSQQIIVVQRPRTNNSQNSQQPAPVTQTRSS
jgi:hypothetical protein